MIEKEKLKDYANKLMFDMDDSEYSVLQDEFETILKQMDLIGNIPNIESVSPMTFPFKNMDVSLREDEVEESVPIEELLQNCDDATETEVRVPKVVGGEE